MNSGARKGKACYDKRISKVAPIEVPCNHVKLHTPSSATLKADKNGKEYLAPQRAKRCAGKEVELGLTWAYQQKIADNKNISNIFRPPKYLHESGQVLY